MHQLIWREMLPLIEGTFRTLFTFLVACILLLLNFNASSIIINCAAVVRATRLRPLLWRLFLLAHWK